MITCQKKLIKMCKNYHPQTFLEKCKNVVKEKEVTRHITEDLEIFLIQMNLRKNSFLLINAQKSLTGMKSLRSASFFLL